MDKLMSLDQSERAQRIREMVAVEMDKPGVCTSPYRHLLTDLAERTGRGKHHCFFTTNWDELLEREIDAKLGFGGYTPAWLPDTHVFHLNGTLEAQNDRRSPILTERDTANARTVSLEFNMAIADVIWSQRFVVVGMSFTCPTDRAFLGFLRSIRDKVPAGCSRWVVVNPDEATAREVAGRILGALPKSRVRLALATFEDWLSSGMLELVDAGVLRGR
jgi:hypothetical protein